jgi:hypothetical protein
MVEGLLMPQTTYEYDITTDTLNAKVDNDRLMSELLFTVSGITTAMTSVASDATTIYVTYMDALSTEEKGDLDDIISSHTGEPVVQKPSEVIIDSSPPFAAKTLSNGKKLFSRVKGTEYALVAGFNALDFSIPYPQVKFNELEIIGCELGDKATLRIKDDASGTYSAVPNYTLNTFGDEVYMTKDYYHRASSYDADLYINMRIYVEFESVSAKTIYINYILHELKD